MRVKFLAQWNNGSLWQGCTFWDRFTVHVMKHASSSTTTGLVEYSWVHRLDSIQHWTRMTMTPVYLHYRLYLSTRLYIHRHIVDDNIPTYFHCNTTFFYITNHIVGKTLKVKQHVYVPPTLHIWVHIMPFCLQWSSLVDDRYTCCMIFSLCVGNTWWKETKWMWLL